MYYKTSKIKTGNTGKTEVARDEGMPEFVLQNFNIGLRPFTLRSITYAASYT